MKILYFLLFLSPLIAHAEFRIGGSAELGSISIDDPDGSTQATTTLIPYLTSSFDLKRRGHRINSGIGYINFSNDATTEVVGQNVSGWSLYSEYEFQMPVSREISDLYLSIGGRLINTEHTDRHLVDRDGFLQERLSNRDETSITLFGSSTYYFFSTEKYEAGFGLYIDQSISGNYSAIGGRLVANF